MRNHRLQNWLDAATAGLSAESKRRVGNEITDHFRNARDEGFDDNAALERLGDPLGARREFRRTYLTSFQEHLVRDYRGYPPKWRWVAYTAIFAIGCGVVLRMPETALQRRAGLVMVLVLSAAWTLLCLVVPRLYRRGRERIAILLGALSDWALYVGLIGGSSIVLGDLTPGKIAFFFTVLGVLLILYLPLLRKLQRSGRGKPLVR